MFQVNTNPVAVDRVIYSGSKTERSGFPKDTCSDSSVWRRKHHAQGNRCRIDHVRIDFWKRSNVRTVQFKRRLRVVPRESGVFRVLPPSVAVTGGSSVQVIRCAKYGSAQMRGSTTTRSSGPRRRPEGRFVIVTQLSHPRKTLITGLAHPTPRGSLTSLLWIRLRRSPRRVLS